MEHHVLIVEDYEDTRKVLEHFSEHSMMDVKTLSNGPDALTYLGDTNNPVDAVIIDLAMYPMDGISLVEKIRLLEQSAIRPNKLKLAFFTAQIVDEAIENTIREVKARPNVFKKPINLEVFFDEIRLWLEEN